MTKPPIVHLADEFGTIKTGLLERGVARSAFEIRVVHADHWIKVPGSPMTYAQEDEQLVYVQPRSGMTKYIYIDRVVAIRHKP